MCHYEVSVDFTMYKLLNNDTICIYIDFFTMQFCLPAGTKSTGKWRLSGDLFRLVAWYHFYLLLYLHYRLIKLINSGFCPVLLVVATPKIKDRDLVVFAPAIIPLGKCCGGVVCSDFNQSDWKAYWVPSSVIVLTDEESFWEHAVRGGMSDEEDEGEPTWTQECQPAHHGGIPVCTGEAYVSTHPCVCALHLALST